MRDAGLVIGRGSAAKEEIMGSTGNDRTTFLVLGAGLLLAACASVPDARTQLEVRASGARTAADHLAIAAEYEALSRQELESSARHMVEARREQRSEELRSQGRFARIHPAITAGQWELRAMAEARAAQEASALAQLHQEMAAAGR
jgi:hypothetical protein